MTSLRRRLARVLLVLLGGLVTQWVLADRTIVYVVETEMETRLRHDADSLLASLAIDAAGRLQVDGRLAGTIYSRPYSGHYFVIQGDNQRITSPSFAAASDRSVQGTILVREHAVVVLQQGAAGRD